MRMQVPTYMGTSTYMCLWCNLRIENVFEGRVLAPLQGNNSSWNEANCCSHNTYLPEVFNPFTL